MDFEFIAYAYAGWEVVCEGEGEGGNPCANTIVFR
jgi:hypothetical protein